MLITPTWRTQRAFRPFGGADDLIDAEEAGEQQSDKRNCHQDSTSTGFESGCFHKGSRLPHRFHEKLLT